MRNWLRRMRGAFGMGLSWAIGWAITGVLIGGTSFLIPGILETEFFRIFDAPLPALAIPGFFGGVFFSAVLGIAGRRRRFSELSTPVFAAWGAVGGLLLSLFPLALFGLGLGTPAPGLDLWKTTATIAGPFVVLSAVSAVVTLKLARRAEERESAGDASPSEVDAGAGAAELGAPPPSDQPLPRSERASRQP